MKTIEEQAREYACDGIHPDSLECKSCYNIYGKCNYEAFLAGAKAATRWISVEGELPELYVPVLVVMIKPELKADDIQRGVCAYLGHGIWINQFGTVDAPTHWLPIPPMPGK